MNNFINGMERRYGFDLNGDGYIGGEGFMGRMERWTGIDINRDGILGQPYDVHPTFVTGYGYGQTNTYYPRTTM
ncbi:unnamed protein product [Adineta ricciae]|uniref:EF-hand domain-containing protein n=1 Tax=Adineta ricciae TaxID=249248 RepID=A0A816CWM0_ADIRI|nr:unnamed protein product [Adineta ricciae]CAF1629162.1 unnamed protein product [Adineta ricciae]